jgi:hypothetical protein
MLVTFRIGSYVTFLCLTRSEYAMDSRFDRVSFEHPPCRRITALAALVRVFNCQGLGSSNAAFVLFDPIEGSRSLGVTRREGLIQEDHSHHRASRQQQIL